LLLPAAAIRARRLQGPPAR